MMTLSFETLMRALYGDKLFVGSGFDLNCVGSEFKMYRHVSKTPVWGWRYISNIKRWVTTGESDDHFRKRILRRAWRNIVTINKGVDALNIQSIRALDDLPDTHNFRFHAVTETRNTVAARLVRVEQVTRKTSLTIELFDAPDSQLIGWIP